MSFRYERLPNICYWCGCFDHSDRDCDTWIQSSGTLKVEEQQFGSWIRATQSGPPKKNVVRVSGFYEERVENVSTRRRKEMRFSPAAAGPIPEGNPEKSTHKESIFSGADYGEINKTNPHNPVSETESSFPAAQTRENQGMDFEEQLNEIDTELGIYEELKKSGFAEGEAPLTEFVQPINVNTLSDELDPIQQYAEQPPGDAPSHRPHARPLLDVTNQNHPPSSVEPLAQTKWKRIFRESSGKTSNSEHQIGLKRFSDMAIDICESPCKKFLVSNENKENYSMLAEAGSQPRQAQ